MIMATMDVATKKCQEKGEKMADSKIFKLIDGIEVDSIARGVEGYLRDKKNLITESLKTPEGWLIQAKQAEGWKKFAGMDTAIQVQLMPTSELLTVNIGSGKWIDKAGAATVGMVLFAPLAVTAAIGAWGQKKLPSEIFEFIELFIQTGGKSAIVTMGASQALKDGQVLCPNCHIANEKGQKFCSSCGTKLMASCPNCQQEVPLGVKFCPECGSSMEPIKEHELCSNCGCNIPEGVKFCPQCGTPVIQKTEKLQCPNCHCEFEMGTKFCPQCGNAVSEQ